MTLIEWRKSPERRSMAIDLFQNQTLEQILAVMDLESPAKRPVPLRDGFDATFEVGRIRGFQEAMEMFNSFRHPLPSAPESIPVTWGAEPELPKT